MNNRFEFIMGTFKGIGLGLTFGYEHKIEALSGKYFSPTHRRILNSRCEKLLHLKLF